MICINSFSPSLSTPIPCRLTILICPMSFLSWLTYPTICQTMVPLLLRLCYEHLRFVLPSSELFLPSSELFQSLFRPNSICCCCYGSSCCPNHHNTWNGRTSVSCKEVHSKFNLFNKFVVTMISSLVYIGQFLWMFLYNCNYLQIISSKTFL